MAYCQEEKETVYVYEYMTNMWRVESSVPKDIKRLMPHMELSKPGTVVEIEDGKTIYVSGFLKPDYSFRVKKPRQSINLSQDMA
ncbi:hypothetical protein ACG30_14820 [Listeria monocytogenes]|nr:hypothetical protein [Listeria monocytogenes]